MLSVSIIPQLLLCIFANNSRVHCHGNSFYQTITPIEVRRPPSNSNLTLTTYEVCVVLWKENKDQETSATTLRDTQPGGRNTPLIPVDHGKGWRHSGEEYLENSEETSPIVGEIREGFVEVAFEPVLKEGVFVFLRCTNKLPQVECKQPLAPVQPGTTGSNNVLPIWKLLRVSVHSSVGPKCA